MPVDTESPFTKESWQTYRAGKDAGTLDYKFRLAPELRLHVFNLNLLGTDLLEASMAHSRYTLLFQLMGSGIYVGNRGHTRTFHERSCNLLSAEEGSLFYYQFKDQRTCLLLLIQFSAEFIRSLDREMAFPESKKSHFLTPQNIIIDRLLLDLLSEILFPDCSPEWEDFILEELMRTLIHWVLDKKALGPFQPLNIIKEDVEQFQMMKQQLFDVKHKTLPFQKLLQTAGIVRIKYFRKLLKSFCGLTIRELLTESRITEAQALLRTTELPIKQIATNIGYKNVYYFSKAFKQYTGMPPAAFQKSNEE